MTASVSSTVTRPTQQHKQSTLRAVLISLLVVLSGYYVWVLYKAITPNVSLAYKTYYIKNQTLYWQPKQPNLTLAIPSNLNVTDKIPNLSRAGWSFDTDNKMRELTQQGGLYFTLASAPTTNVKIKFTFAKTQSQLKPLTFTFNHHQGMLQAQGNTLVAQLPQQQFFPTAQQLQTFIVTTPIPLQVTTISLTPMNVDTLLLPHNTGHFNQKIGNIK
ncbi:riboflavin synthase subunit alpha [Photobacterium carnosum]|uniref:riboflavin synthase subunit alpha n=1 Tax=Photobacterium carnosum TaxID=2023717 RepID=UPI001C92035C|nr:riboflavin synthase subunit alpha [Photobacterium carnosum]MBY3786893.1 riboflavin synthase subunit alpha [Photobacterium carnosum]MCD9532899.1 riboflavin synthase subunit alpha [Photobacterium carnosum]